MKQVRTEVKSLQPGKVVYVRPKGADDDGLWTAKIVGYMPDGSYRVRSTREDAITVQTVDAVEVFDTERVPAPQYSRGDAVDETDVGVGEVQDVCWDGEVEEWYYRLSRDGETFYGREGLMTLVEPKRPSSAMPNLPGGGAQLH